MLSTAVLGIELTDLLLGLVTLSAGVTVVVVFRIRETFAAVKQPRNDNSTNSAASCGVSGIIESPDAGHLPGQALRGAMIIQGWHLGSGTTWIVVHASLSSPFSFAPVSRRAFA